MAAARSLNPKDRNTVEDPKKQVFWSAASARKPQYAAGKKLGDEGFGRGRTAIGHRKQSRGWFSGNTHVKEIRWL
jgi:hypothetical protein